MWPFLRPRYLIIGGIAGVGATEWVRGKMDLDSIGIVRFGRAALAAGSIAFDYQTSIYGKRFPTDENELKQLWSSVHKRSADRLLSLCTANRGVFIKVGQHLGALDYLLPPEYIQTLRILHNQAPVSSIQDVYRVIKEDLKSDKSELFKEFDEKPLGAASLAQVYKAKLATGDIVAVKVQHRAVLGHATVDIATMEVLVRLAAWVFPDFKLLWLAEETKKNLPVELDFLNEGKNADTIAALFTHCKWLKVPKIYWNLSSKRVLVMEYCEGGQVNDLEYMQNHKISGIEVAAKLGQLYSEMIFVNGCVHCDPHPGNILVRNNSKGKLELCLLDHGLYTTLSPEFRYNYSKFWLSILSSDVKGIEQYGKELGVGNLSHLFACMVTARSWDSIASTEGITKQKLSAEEQELIRKNIGGFLPQISEILENVPRPMIMIFKTNDLLRGVEYALRTQKTMKSFTTMSKFCIRAVFSENIRKCTTSFCTFKNILQQQWALTRVCIYEVFVWFQSVIWVPFYNS